MASLSALKELYIHKNRIAALPAALFSNMKDLANLNASNNELKEIPLSMCKCKKLKNISLYQNDIPEIPLEFMQLRALESLHLYVSFFPTQGTILNNHVIPSGMATLWKICQSTYSTTQPRLRRFSWPCENASYCWGTRRNEALVQTKPLGRSKAEETTEEWAKEAMAPVCV